MKMQCSGASICKSSDCLHRLPHEQEMLCSEACGDKLLEGHDPAFCVEIPTLTDEEIMRIVLKSGEVAGILARDGLTNEQIIQVCRATIYMTEKEMNS